MAFSIQNMQSATILKYLLKLYWITSGFERFTIVSTFLVVFSCVQETIVHELIMWDAYKLA